MMMFAAQMRALVGEYGGDLGGRQMSFETFGGDYGPLAIGVTERHRFIVVQPPGLGTVVVAACGHLQGFKVPPAGASTSSSELHDDYGEPEGQE
nr:hypothetical protein [Amycolatopsis keratiniphila]